MQITCPYSRATHCRRRPPCSSEAALYSRTEYHCFSIVAELTRHVPYGIITPYRIQVISFGACFHAPKVSERRCKDEQKRTPRNIDTQHEGMELHRVCPGNVDAEIAFRVILFSI